MKAPELPTGYRLSHYDARRLDLLPFLFLPDQLEAVRAAGGIENARRRLTGGQN